MRAAVTRTGSAARTAEQVIAAAWMPWPVTSPTTVCTIHPGMHGTVIVK
jgi:hypothetical protein